MLQHQCLTFFKQGKKDLSTVMGLTRLETVVAHVAFLEYV